MSRRKVIVLCPGQGAQKVGMGRAWYEQSTIAREVFAEADAVLGDSLGGLLSELCFEGPADRLNQTDVSQPALYVCGVAGYRGWIEQEGEVELVGAAGLSLGEYTALHLAGAFDFASGLQLVAKRGRLMQEAAEVTEGSMVALIGADEDQAQAVCEAVLNPRNARKTPVGVGGAGGESGNGNTPILVAANYNAPGQIVLSGDRSSCEQAVEVATGMDLRATALTVAGAFHSPLMESAAGSMGEALADVDMAEPQLPVWSNVTGLPHEWEGTGEHLRSSLVQQIVSPVRWAQSCEAMVGANAGKTIEYHEVSPGSVLRGLMRRIDRKTKVMSHDEPK